MEITNILISVNSFFFFREGGVGGRWEEEEREKRLLCRLHSQRGA